MTATC